MIITSKGKSILSVGLTLPITQINSPFLPDTPPPNVQSYIAAARSINPVITEAAKTFAEDSFVDRRREQNITAEEFSLNLTMARWIARSYFSDEVTSEHLIEAQDLYDRIKARS